MPEIERLRQALRGIVRVVRGEPSGSVLDTVYVIARVALYRYDRALAAAPAKKEQP